MTFRSWAVIKQSRHEPVSLRVGLSTFLRDGTRVFHTYFVYARGAPPGGSYYFLDVTALGRQEDWETPMDRVPQPRANVPEFTT
jgi:predicted dithiol-disulfide oxidoreductase (DUF899 family)